ncbi:DUF4123 domain-containing protein [Candidatus Vondammii sp. HM_W22]|uniref:DUF4123 domain-containing protein n=1 Tax=Candidatus Vondammii sp. HM_W22 TaxID=2687299 RepID=UPI001F12BA51|nr:DUF4123 domain-containing protein [Candidatus Vondammii sp. HM_W22]
MDLVTHWQQLLEKHSPPGADGPDYVLAESRLNFDLSLLSETAPSRPMPLFEDMAMAEYTPHLYRIEADEAHKEVLHQLLQAGIGQHGLCFIWSPLDGDALLSHLRRHSQVEDADGQRHWLRYWDPRVLPYLQQGMQPQQAGFFYSGIHRIGCEDYRDPQKLCLFQEKHGPPPQHNRGADDWGGPGIPLLPPGLARQLMQGFQAYTHYRLARHLFDDYPKAEQIPLDELEAWVWSQSETLLKRGVDDSEIQRRLISAAWVQGQDLAETGQDANDRGLHSYSETLWRQARADYHSSTEELEHGITD